MSVGDSDRHHRTDDTPPVGNPVVTGEGD
jgi:hypothetical protein